MRNLLRSRHQILCRRGPLFIIFSFLWHSFLNANCLVDFNAAIEKRLSLELRLEQNPVLRDPKQRIFFNRMNFSADEQEMVLETVAEVNAMVAGMKGVKVPKSLSLSCGIEVSNGCLHFHHLYFNVDDLSFGSNLSRLEKKAIVAHEYGHMIFNRSLYEELPELLEYWKYGNDHLAFKKLADRAVTEAERTEFLKSGNEARLKQLELEEAVSFLRLYDALGEFFADAIAVSISKNGDIIADSIAKSYLRKIPKYKQFIDLPDVAKRKLDHRRFGFSSGLEVEVSGDIHQTFSMVRNQMSVPVKTADLFQAVRSTFLELIEKNPEMVKNFSDLINRMDRGETLPTAEKIGFENMVKKFNELLANYLSLKNRS